MQFKNKRNYETEVFYEDEKPYLRIEYDGDTTCIENGVESEITVHCIIHKISLSDFKFDRIEILNAPAKNEITFDVHPDNTGGIIVITYNRNKD